MTATNYSIMRCTRAEWDAWAVTTDEDGTERPATGQEMLDRGVASPEIGPDDVVYHCGILDTDRRAALPGEVLTVGRLRDRHVALPDVALKRRMYGARVYREPGADLRSSANAAVNRTLAARVPANGSRSAMPADPPGALLVLEEARRRAGDEDDPVVERMVRMDEVEDTDVVAEDAVVRVVWAGER